MTRRAAHDPAQLSWFEQLLAPFTRAMAPSPAPTRRPAPPAPQPSATRRPDASRSPEAVPAAPTAADAMLVRLRTLGLRGVDRLVLTRNRTVLVSLARGVLRVHAGFVDAPDEVARAVAVFATTRDRAARARAQSVITAHPLPASAVRPRRATTQHPEDAGMAQRLTELHGALNLEHFGGALTPLEIRVSRRLARRLGHYALRQGDAPGEIVLSRRHIRRDGWAEATHTLLHEMVHQWQDESGLPVDHGAAFRRKCRAVGIHPGAVRAID